MYYHIRIDYYDNRLKANWTLFDLDKESQESIITDCVEPYMRQKNFYFKGSRLVPASIVQLQVYSTEYTMQQCIDMEERATAETSFGIPTTEVDILDDSHYSKNITSETLKLTEQYIYDMDHPDTFRQQVIDAKNNKRQDMQSKKPKVFISHKTEDSNFAKAIIDVLIQLGLRHTDIFCSSVPGYGIPFGNKITDALHNQFDEFNLFVIFIHSPRYYASPVSLNEMGAAWILRSKHVSFLTKDCTFGMLKGVINSGEIAFKAGKEDTEHLLHDFRTMIKDFFGLEDIPNPIWESTKNTFIARVKSFDYTVSEDSKSENTLVINNGNESQTNDSISSLMNRSAIPMAPNQNPSAYFAGAGSSKDKVLACIRENGKLTTAEIAESLRLSRTAVERCLSELEQNGIIIKAPPRTYKLK